MRGDLDRFRRHPIAVADVAFALREAGERPKHDLLSVIEGVPARFADAIVADVLVRDVGGEEIVLVSRHVQHGELQFLETCRTRDHLAFGPVLRPGEPSEGLGLVAGGVRPRYGASR